MNLNSTDRDIRKFGVVAVLFFGGLSTLAVWRQHFAVLFLFGPLFLLGVCFLTLPGPFRPIYTRWLKMAHGIGIVITQLILTIAYFLIITPSAWIKRILGGRPLPLKPDRNAESYWVARKEPAQPKERFYLRY